MIKIHRLKQPNKNSGYKLEPNKTVEMRGMTITNNNKFDVYLDKFIRKPWKPTKQVKEY